MILQKPRKPKPVSNLENELMPQISRSASLDSINSAAGNMGIVSAVSSSLPQLFMYCLNY